MGAISGLFGYVLDALYNLINNYGVAIIIFSVFLRLILIPITYKQQKSMIKNSELQDEMKVLQLKYKNNPEQLNKETMELYKREGVSPFSGCLSGILQIIIILSVFWLVSQPLTYMKKVQTSEIYNQYKTEIEENSEGRATYREIAIINRVESDYNKIAQRLENNEYEEETSDEVKLEEINNEDNKEESEKIDETSENTDFVIDVDQLKTKKELEERKDELETLRINMEFLGLDLSKVPTQSLSDWKVYIIPVLYVITSFISIRMTTKTQKPKKDGEESEQDDSMQQMSKSMSYMMPIMSISIAAIAPLGLALYWLVSNLLMIIERIVINKIMISKEEKENV